MKKFPNLNILKTVKSFNINNINFTKSSMWKKPKKHSLSAGFSLLELVTVVAIIAILLAVATPFYGKYQRRAIQGRMKHELASISKALAYAHSVDGGYHQRIYTAGYKPDQELITEAGFKYTRDDNPCCNLFPNFGPTANFSKFFTITKDKFSTNPLLSATRATHICDGGKCKINGDRVPSTVKNIVLSSIPSGGSNTCGFPSGTPGFGSCSCEAYKIYAVSYWRSNMYLYADEKGKFCAKTGTDGDEEI